ncbi:MAG: glycine cleavage system aminomethyltransferase GcvT [Maritimibacter sp.]
MGELKRTVLYDLHKDQGAKMVPFAGYEMPVQYPMGVMKEHLHTRASAGLFDVSHMGQIMVRPKSGEIKDAAQALESLMPADVLGLARGRQRYGMFTNTRGGVIDDLMIANVKWTVGYFLVVNAANAPRDIAHLEAHIAETCEIEVLSDRALLALQGPKAEAVLAHLLPKVGDMRFMDHEAFNSDDLWVSRSGYTGDDGFEISLPADRAESFARDLLALDDVAPIGLGARDSLRMEAGLPLHGQEMDADTTPLSAGLGWGISKHRKTGGAREGGFPGAEIILAEIDAGAHLVTTGLIPDGRAPMRAGTLLFAGTDAPVGHVTSGGFAPSLGHPISIARLPAEFARQGMSIEAEVRGKRLSAKVTKLPFRPTTYKR